METYFERSSGAAGMVCDAELVDSSEMPAFAKMDKIHRNSFASIGGRYVKRNYSEPSGNKYFEEARNCEYVEVPAYEGPMTFGDIFDTEGIFEGKYDGGGGGVAGALATIGIVLSLTLLWNLGKYLVGANVTRPNTTEYECRVQYVRQPYEMVPEPTCAMRLAQNIFFEVCTPLM